MGKIVLNQSRNNLTLAGITLRHDELLDQPVTRVSDVMFNNLTVNNITALGNVQYQGSVTSIETDTIVMKDAIVDLNFENEHSLLTGGFRIQRGPGLTPFSLLYNEPTRDLRIGFEPNMRIVATRAETLVDKNITVWDSTSNNFTTTNDLSVPIKFSENVTLKENLILGEAVNSPILSTNQTADLLLGSNSKILLNVGTSVHIPAKKRLYFSTDSSIYTNDAGSMVFDSPRLVFPSGTALDLGQYSRVYSFGTGGNDLALEGIKVSLQATDSILMNGVPLVHAGVGTLSPVNGNYRISSSGHILLEPGVDKRVIVKNLSIDEKVQLLTDASGSLSINSTGDMYLNPLLDVKVASGKRLAFTNSNLQELNQDLYMNSENALIFNAKTQVYIPASIPLNMAQGLSLGETPQGNALLSSSTGDIVLQPATLRSVKVPTSVPLIIGSGQITSTITSLILTGTSDIQFSAPQGVRIAQNVPLTFGGPSHRMYQNTQNHLIFESSNDIRFAAGENVVITTRSLKMANSLFYEDPVDNALTFIPNPAAGFVKTTGSFIITGTQAAVSSGSGSLATLGGVFVKKNLLVEGSTNVNGKFSLNDVVAIENAPIPISVTNASALNGTVLGMKAQWDTTAGYTLGRGNGGRAFAFTIPPFQSYGAGSLPSFTFGDSAGIIYALLTAEGLALNSGTLYIGDVSGNSFKTLGGAAIGGNLVSTGNLSACADSFVVQLSGVTVKSKLTVKNNFTVDSDFGASIFSVDQTLTNVNSPIQFNDTATFSLGVSMTSGLSVSELSVDGNMDLRGHRILNLAEPDFPSDPVTKNYADNLNRNFSAKKAVLVASTVNVDLSNRLYNMDNIDVQSGARLLLKDQTNPIENGLYVIDGDGFPVRASDLPVGEDAAGSSVFVVSGDTNSTTGFVVVGSGVDVGNDPMVWTAFSGSSSIEAGLGITKTGKTISVAVDGFSIDNTSGTLQIKQSLFSTGLTGGIPGVPVSTSTNQSHVTSVGLLTAGTWRASVVETQYGGTGSASLPSGYLLVGNGTGPIKTMEKMFVKELNGFVGMGTIDPRANLHIVNSVAETGGAWLRLQDAAPQLSQSSGFQISTITNNARLALLADGTFQMGQDDLSSASRISFSTKRISRMHVDADGNVVVGSSLSTPFPDSIVSVYGKMTTTSSINMKSGNLILPSLTVSTFGAGTLFETPLATFSAGISVSGNVQLGNISFTSTVDGETTMSSTNSLSGLGIPLKIRSHPSIIAAIVSNEKVVIPGILQVGGNESNTASGFSIKTVGNNLIFNPGVAGSAVMFNSPIAFGDGLNLYDSATPLDPVRLEVEGRVLSIRSSGSPAVTSAYSFVVGGGNHEIISSFVNKNGSSHVKYDPTDTSEYPGGVFSVSSGILLSVSEELRLDDVLRFNTGNGIEGTLGNIGWYYMGRLGTGRTTMTASLSWTCRIDYDGLTQYTTQLMNYDRNVASLIIYKTDVGIYHMFIKILSAPCRISVLESPNRMYPSTMYEGAGALPNGHFSGFDTIAWTMDLDLSTAQSNANMEFGDISVTNSAELTNTTLQGNTTINGNITLRGDTTSFIGDKHAFLDPVANSDIVTIEKSQDGVSNNLLIHGVNSSNPALIVKTDAMAASLSIMPENAVEYPGAVVLCHKTTNANSAILLKSGNNDGLLVDHLGNVSLLSTADSGALIVHGGASFNKPALFKEGINVKSLQIQDAQDYTNKATLTYDGSSQTVNFAGARLGNIGEPVNAYDAVNLGFIEGLVQGLAVKTSVIAASHDVDIDLDVPITVLDGVALQVGDRFLLKNQQDLRENGIYVVQSGNPPIRSDDLQVATNAATAYVFVSRGLVNANSGWMCTALSGEAVVGINDLSFTQFSGAGQFTVGAGLVKVGNLIQISADAGSIEVMNNQLRLSTGAAGLGLQGGGGVPLRVSSINHLSSVGTLTSGSWMANVIGMAYGGTGSSTFAVGRIPFSNGVSLTQGSLFFDGTNNRLGINTTNPTNGLTLVDRDFEISQTLTSSCSILFTSSSTFQTYAIRNDTSKLIFSTGTGTNKHALADVLSIDQNGGLSTNSFISGSSFLVSNDMRISNCIFDKITPGPFELRHLSTDNSGSSSLYYGGLGSISNLASSEFLRVGYHNGTYLVSTGASGNGVSRSLSLKSGNNEGQLVLYPNNVVSFSGNVNFSSSTDATSVNSGSVTVTGGIAVKGHSFLTSMKITSTGDTSLSTNGGITCAGSVFVGSGQSVYALKSQPSGHLTVQSLVSNTDTVFNLSSKGGDNLSNVMLTAFGKGSGSMSEDSAEWIQMGFEKSTSRYSIRTASGSTGVQRPLIISAKSSVDQMVFNPNGNINIQGSLIINGPVVITEPTDSTSSVSGSPSLVLYGGLAVAKSLHVGDTVNTAVVKVTNFARFSSAGSLDSISVSYKSTGQLNFFDNSNTVLHIHSGVSEGPDSPNQEKLVIGYGSVNSHIIRTVGNGNGTVKDLVLQTGDNYENQLKLNAIDGSISMSTNLRINGLANALSTVEDSGSLVVAGGALVKKDVVVKGSLTIGSGSIGTVISLKGAGEFKFISRDAQTLSLQPTVNSVFSINRADGSDLVKFDTLNKTVLCNGTSSVRANSSQAFSINTATGNELFSFDTLNHVLNMAAGRITNLGLPQLATDACTKSYVDNLIKGLNLKKACEAASTGTNVDIMSPVNGLDDVVLQPGDRVLLMNQTNAVENGIWEVTVNNYLVRASDFAVEGHGAGAFTFVLEGTLRGDKGYVCISDFPNDLIGANNLAFSQFNGNVVSAGLGLFKDGNNFLNVDIVPTGSGLSFSGNRLRIDPNIAGNGLSFENGRLEAIPLSDLGTVRVGRWEAEPISMAFGGTSNNTFLNKGIVFSDGGKLLSSPNLTFDYTLNAIGVNGDAVEGNAITVHQKDLSINGIDGSLLFASSSGDYNWRIRNSEASPYSRIARLGIQSWSFANCSGDSMVFSSTTSIYLSKNGGQSWSEILEEVPNATWVKSSISGDGSVILLPNSGGSLYISTDFGTTFRQKMADSDRLWSKSSISFTGGYLLASARLDAVYRSVDSGDTWTTVTGLPDDEVAFVHVNKTGETQFVGYRNGGVFVSRDHGLTFAQDQSLPIGNWEDVKEANTNNLLVMYQNAGSIWVSSNNGNTWSEKLVDTQREWISVAMTTNGNKIVAADHSGYIWLSTDYGVTWTEKLADLDRPWTFVHISTDGQTLYAGGTNIPISQSTDGGIVWNEITTNLDLACTAFSAKGDLVYAETAGSVNRYNVKRLSDFIISSGSSTNKGNLSDFVHIKESGSIGFGYTDSTEISETLNVHGSMFVDGEITFVEPLSTASGGTGSNNLGHGILVGNGKGPVSSMNFHAGSVVIGDIDGKPVMESGASLRTRLGLGIGSAVQGFNENLQDIAGLTPLDNYVICGNGSNFVSLTLTAILASIGFGDLAYLSTVNNNNWSGSPLSVSNGGTGATTFANGTIAAYNGTKFMQTLVSYDFVTEGLAIGNIKTVHNGSYISIYDKDISIQTNSESASKSILFRNPDGDVEWGVSRNTDSFSISGGSPFATKEALETRMEILNTGEVRISSLTAADEDGSASLSLSGGLFVQKNIVQSGEFSILSLVDYSDSTGVASFSTSGGAYVAKKLAVGGDVTLAGAVVVSDTTETSSFSTGALIVSGGLVSKGIFRNQGEIVVGSSLAVLSKGITIGVDTLQTWDNDVVISNSSRGLSIINNDLGIVCLNMRSMQSTNGWDILVDSTNDGDRLCFTASAIDNQTAKTWLTIDATSGSLKVFGSEDVDSDLSPSIRTAGGILCEKTLKCANVETVNVIVENSSADSEAFSRINLVNDSGSGALITMNSSARTDDNGPEAMTIRNTRGNVYVHGSNGSGISIEGNTGNVNVDERLIVSSTADNSVVFSGGMSVAKDLEILGNLVISGTVTTGDSVVTTTFETPLSDTVNVSGLVLHRAKLVKNNGFRNLFATFVVTPSAASLNTQFTFILPDRQVDLLHVFDIDNAQVSGFRDDVNFVVLQNMLCVGAVGTKKCMVKFQSAHTDQHYINVMVAYSVT